MFIPSDLFAQMAGEALQLFFRLHQGVVHPRLPQRAQWLQIAFLVDAQAPLEVIVPGLQAAAGGQGPHAHAALLDAVAPAQRGAVVLVMGRTAPHLFAQARQQPGLIALELDQCVAAEPDDALDRVFCKCSASSVYRQSLSPSSLIRRWAAAIS